MERIHACHRFLAPGILLLSLGYMSGEVVGQQEARTLIANQFEKWQSGEANFFGLLDDFSSIRVSFFRDSDVLMIRVPCRRL